jgi:hypothetical protein
LATDVPGPRAAVVLIAGMGGGATGGGMRGGATGGTGGRSTTGGTTGGMGGGGTTGGMGAGGTTGGMGGGGTAGGMGGGGMGGGGTTGGGVFGTPGPSFGTNSNWPGNSAQSSYYTYQCATTAGVCSFVAPASLRSTSLRAGARCSCSDGMSQGQIK